MDKLNQVSNRLFPSKLSSFVFFSYISLFVSSGLLIRAAQNKYTNGFNQIIIVLSTELLKFVICLALYHINTHQYHNAGLMSDIKRNSRLLFLYLIPALLYCFYNNLAFVNLKLFDPTTYFCLMQFRIALTAVIYQILFRRKLTRIQWISLLVLTLGCLIKGYGLYTITNYDNPHSTQVNGTANSIEQISNQQSQSFDYKSQQNQHITLLSFLWLTSSILVQMFCSCFAGVYNEYLLKDHTTSADADFILQNMFMYLDSILCNVIMYYVTDIHSSDKSTSSSETRPLVLLNDPLIIIVILNNALSGLVASLFLKNLNSILKTFASSLELFAVALLAWIIFGDIIDRYTIIALFMVSFALIVYSRNPVSTAPPDRITDKQGFEPVPTSDHDEAH